MIRSLYLHIPFCEAKCLYCSFASFPGFTELHGVYLDCLVEEVSSLAKTAGSGPLSTIFIGGGTPTILSAPQLERLLAACIDGFGVVPGAEISIEANPGTVDYAKLAGLQQAGCNRISIGVQSFNDKELALLGRKHCAADAVAAFTEARRAGFDNISLDLMYGVPGQELCHWQANLDTALSLEPDHLSLYQLTMEGDTPMARRYKDGQLKLPGDEDVLAMDGYNLAATSAAGLEMYEISNYCRSGRECRHNITYWLNDEYLAAGAGAVSYVAGVRERRVEDPKEYCRLVTGEGTPVSEHEKLDSDEIFRETVVMGLRMNKGVSRSRLLSRFDIDPVLYYGTVLSRLQGLGVVELTDSHLRLTSKGRLLANSVMAELV